MKKKIYYYVFLICCILVLIILFLFTGIVSNPVFVYSPSTDKKIVRLATVSDVYVDSNKANIKFAEKCLKYSDNIKSLHIINQIDNIDFIPKSNNLKEFSAEYPIKNWDFLLNCSNLENIFLMSSNFNDFSLLKSMNNISVIDIETTEEINYIDFSCFEHLSELCINAQNVSITKIASAPMISFLWMENVGVFDGSDNIKNLSELKKLCIFYSKLDYDFLKTIENMQIENLTISDCFLDEDNIDMKEIEQIFSSDEYQIEIKEDKFSVSTID